MSITFRMLNALILALGLSTAASAATYNISGSFSGGQLGNVAFDVTIAADFSASIAETTTGLTINSLTSSVVSGNPFPVGGGLGYTYNASVAQLIIGGFTSGVGGISSPYTDFGFSIRAFTTAPVAQYVGDTRAGRGGLATGLESTASLVVTPVNVSPVPLPAGGVLLLTGLIGVAALRRRKHKPVALDHRRPVYLGRWDSLAV